MSDTQIRLFTVSTLLIHAFSSYSRGMTEEIDNSTTTLEIKWRFSRCPENSPERISLKHNPHFYLELPEDAASYGSKFHKDPLKDFAYRRTDTVYILLDKSCRLFLNTADSRMSNIFGNLWRPYQKVILKGESLPAV